MDGNHPRQLRPAHAVHHRPGADDDYKAASKGAEEAVDYKQYMPKLKPEHKLLRRVIKIVVTVVVIAGLGTGAYLIGSNYNSKGKTPVKKTVAATTKVAAPTETYTSNYQDLSFTYPENWKINETSTAITATSPPTDLTNYARKMVLGRIIFRIRAQNVPLTEFNAGDATAVLNSQIIDYSAPTSAQLGSTYISFLNYANSTGSGIDGIYVTGNTGYQAGQNAPESDIQAVDPVISFTFEKCTNKACSTTSSLTITTGSWSKQSLSSPLLAILKSLSIS